MKIFTKNLGNRKGHIRKQLLKLIQIKVEQQKLRYWMHRIKMVDIKSFKHIWAARPEKKV